MVTTPNPQDLRPGRRGCPDTTGLRFKCSLVNIFLVMLT